MGSLDDLARGFFDTLYTYRLAVAVGSVVAVVVLALVAQRLGWFAAARRHRARAIVVVMTAVAIAVPLTWYVSSPLVVRTELIEPDPIALVVTPAPTTPSPASIPSAASSRPEPSTFTPSIVATGSFSGTDDFHFGRGTASIIETTPGAYVLRFKDFSVRNGPDLFVYLSPDAADYTRGALELGRLKATDGAFGYELPAGTDPADFASAIIWCKQFSHLFAVAPFEAA